jgi:hypothetical protein
MTLARFGKLSLMLTALLLGNAFLYIMVSGSMARFLWRRFNIVGSFESGEKMLLEMFAVLAGLIVIWALGGLRTLRSVLIAAGVVASVATVMAFFG